MKFYFVIACLLCSLLTSCKHKDNDSDITTPAQDLYDQGTLLIEKKEYKEAAETFSKIYFQHPGSSFTPKAELMEAQAYYLAHEYEETIDVLENFIKLHPLHEEISYAYHLKALASYMLIPNIYHDQNKTKTAVSALEDVILRFPHTNYADDARAKLNLAVDHLAAYEMQIGRYYLKNKNPIAAINRFKVIVNQYQTTLHIAEALCHLVESFLILGLEDEALKYAAVLGTNYPDSAWYKHSLSLLKK